VRRFASTRHGRQDRRSHVAGLYAFGRGGEMTYEGGPCPWGRWDSGAPSGRSILPGAWKTGHPIRFPGPLTVRSPSTEGASAAAWMGGLPADNLVALARALSGRSGTAGRLRGNRPRRQARTRGGGSRIGVTATLGQIGFTSPAGDVMGQNLAGRVDLEALLIRNRG